MHILSPETDLPILDHRKGENDRRKYFMISLHERMLPAPAGSNLQPPDHQSDAHPTEPPRPNTHTWLEPISNSMREFILRDAGIYIKGTEYTFRGDNFVKIVFATFRNAVFS